MKKEQEPKYDCNEFGHLYNRYSSEVIPDDEPVFIFRARDLFARQVLWEYIMLLPPGEHRDAVESRLGDFRKFADQNQSRMKLPDTSR